MTDLGPLIGVLIGGLLFGSGVWTGYAIKNQRDRVWLKKIESIARPPAPATKARVIRNSAEQEGIRNKREGHSDRVKDPNEGVPAYPGRVKNP